MPGIRRRPSLDRAPGIAAAVAPVPPLKKVAGVLIPGGKMQYENKNNFSNLGATATTTSQQVLPENPSRNYFYIENNGTDTVYVAFGAAADVNTAKQLSPGGWYEPWKVPKNSVHILSASGTQACAMIEGIQEDG